MYNPFKLIGQLKKEIKELKERELNPLFYVGKIIKDLKWYDYEKLEKQQWMNYYNDAQQIVNSDVFKNEMDKFITSIISDIARESRSHEETMAKRQAVIFLESFGDRLAAVKDPRTVETQDEIHEAI